MIKHALFILIFLFSFQSIAQKAYKKEYSLTLTGKITDTDNQPIKNAIIRLIYNKEPISVSRPDTTILSADKTGKYNLEITKFGGYRIEISADQKLDYRIKCMYTEKMALGIKDRKFTKKLDIQLLSKTKNITSDIYSGGEIIARRAEARFIPYARYLQAHDYKVRKGFKSAPKANKFIQKRFKKLQLKKTLGLMAKRSEVDASITDKKYSEAQKISLTYFFGLTTTDVDKNRSEMLQQFFAKISELNADGDPVYDLASSKLNTELSNRIDPSNEVAQVLTYVFKNTEGKTLTCETILINTSGKWKIYSLFEVYK